jgi:hypothetical protein
MALPASSIRKLLYLILVATTLLIIYTQTTNPERHWLLWSGLFLSLITYGNSFQKRIVTITVTAIITIACICLAAIASTTPLTLVIFLLIITTACAYFTKRFPEFVLPLFLINLFALLGVYFPPASGEAIMQLQFACEGAAIALLFQCIFWPYYKKNESDALIHAAKLSLRKLNEAIFSCFLQPGYLENKYFYESNLRVHKNKFMRAMLGEKNSAHLNELYAILLDCAQLRGRVSDFTIFQVCSVELTAIYEAMDALLAGKVKDTEVLAGCIDRLEDNYQHVLRVTAKEPGVFVLFIGGLRAFCQAIKNNRAATVRERVGLSVCSSVTLNQCETFNIQQSRSYSAGSKASPPTRSLTVAAPLSILIAITISFFVPTEQAIWLVLTTFFVSQTSPGTPLRQALNYFLIIASALVIAGLINIILITIIITICAYITFIYRPLSNKAFFHLMLFPVVLLIAGVSQPTTPQITEQMMGVLYGAIIGLLFNYLFSALKLKTLFFQGVIPILNALRDDVSEYQIEKTLVSPQSIYPEWVFETGFNPGLRSSWRFVLIHIERMIELYFSLRYLIANHANHAKLLDMSFALEKNAELLTILIHYFEDKKIQFSESDYMSDLDALESELQKTIPQHVDAIDFSPDDVAITAIVRAIRDMRTLLLQLVMGLPQK